MTLPPTIKPMLAEQYDPATQLFPVYVQPKLNGIRGIYHPSVRRFHTRQGKWWNEEITEHVVEKMLPELRDSPYPVDGEFYRPDWPLQRIAGAMAVARVHPNEDTAEIGFHPFDLICAKPFNDRLLLLRDSSEPYLVETRLLRTHQDLDTSYCVYLHQNFEGIIIRSGGAPYIHGLTHAMLKRKPAKDFEGVCIGVTEGKRQHRGKCGALLVQDKAGRVYKVGGGLTESQRNEFWQNQPIGDIVTCSSEAGLSAAGIPVQAHFVAIRNYE